MASSAPAASSAWMVASFVLGRIAVILAVFVLVRKAFLRLHHREIDPGRTAGGDGDLGLLRRARLAVVGGCVSGARGGGLHGGGAVWGRGGQVGGGAGP